MSVSMLHTCIRVKDLEKSVKFYQDAFGLIVTKEKDFPKYEFTLVYLSNEEGGYEIELTYNYHIEKPYELGNGFSHIALGTDDLEGMRDKHIALGYEVTDLSGLPGQPPRYYFVTDPDGYQVEVIRTESKETYFEK